MNTKCPLPKGFSGTTRVFGLLAGLLLSLTIAPGAGAAPLAYVSNMMPGVTPGTVTVIDGTTILATITVGSQPVGVAVNPAGTRVYVANSNASELDVPSVSVIDTASLTEVTRITTGIVDQPSGVAVSEDGAFVYVTTTNGWLHVIDAASNTVLTATKVGEQLGAIVAAGGSVYVIDVFWGTVTNVTNPSVPPFFVSTMVSGIAANADGSRLYVSNGNDFDRNLEVAVIDTTSNPMEFVDPRTFTGLPDARNSVRRNPVQIGTADNDSGLNPAGIAVSASGFVYSAITAEHSVEVRDAATMAKVATIAVPSFATVPSLVNAVPLGIAVDPLAPSVYVVSVPTRNTINITNGKATLIDGTTNTMVQEIPVGRNPMVFGSFVAGDRPIPPPPQFALSLNKVGSGTILVDRPSATGSYSAGTSVTLTASPDLNYAFTGWSGDCLAAGTNTSCTLVMNANKSATATFTAQYALWVTTLGNGTGTVGVAPQANAGKYLAGTSVTLTATPSSNSDFTGWSGDCSTAGTNLSCTLVMNGTKSVSATFTAVPPPPPAQFTLIVNTVGSGSVAAKPPAPAAAAVASARSIAVVQPLAVVGKYNAGTQVTLTATAAPGFRFTGWSSPCTGTGTCVVKMDTDKTLTATFTTEAPPPTTCDGTINDLQKKVAGHKHPWWQNHQLKVALKMYEEAGDDLARALRKVGPKDKRYLHAKKEFDAGKAALCSGHYWRAGHDFWETVVISREILRHRR